MCGCEGKGFPMSDTFPVIEPNVFNFTEKKDRVQDSKGYKQ